MKAGELDDKKSLINIIKDRTQRRRELLSGPHIKSGGLVKPGRTTFVFLGLVKDQNKNPSKKFIVCVPVGNTLVSAICLIPNNSEMPIQVEPPVMEPYSSRPAKQNASLLNETDANSPRKRARAAVKHEFERLMLGSAGIIASRNMSAQYSKAQRILQKQNNQNPTKITNVSSLVRQKMIALSHVDSKSENLFADDSRAPQKNAINEEIKTTHHTVFRERIPSASDARELDVAAKLRKQVIKAALKVFPVHKRQRGNVGKDSAYVTDKERDYLKSVFPNAVRAITSKYPNDREKRKKCYEYMVVNDKSPFSNDAYFERFFKRVSLNKQGKISGSATVDEVKLNNRMARFKGTYEKVKAALGLPDASDSWMSLEDGPNHDALMNFNQLIDTCSVLLYPVGSHHDDRLLEDSIILEVLEKSELKEIILAPKVTVRDKGASTQYSTVTRFSSSSTLEFTAEIEEKLNTLQIRAPGTHASILNDALSNVFPAAALKCKEKIGKSTFSQFCHLVAETGGTSALKDETLVRVATACEVPSVKNPSTTRRLTDAVPLVEPDHYAKARPPRKNAQATRPVSVPPTVYVENKPAVGPGYVNEVLPTINRASPLAENEVQIETLFKQALEETGRSNYIDLSDNMAALSAMLTSESGAELRRLHENPAEKTQALKSGPLDLLKKVSDYKWSKVKTAIETVSGFNQTIGLAWEKEKHQHLVTKVLPNQFMRVEEKQLGNSKILYSGLLKEDELLSMIKVSLEVQNEGFKFMSVVNNTMAELQKEAKKDARQRRSFSTVIQDVKDQMLPSIRRAGEPKKNNGAEDGIASQGEDNRRELLPFLKNKNEKKMIQTKKAVPAGKEKKRNGKGGR